MKKTSFIALAALLMALLSAFTLPEGKNSTFTVNWSFANITEGYDHDNKCKVWVDGKEAGESTVSKESKPNSFKLTLSKGTHEIRVINYALYEGEWQEHSKANEYSIDCMWNGTIEFKKKALLDLVFDLNVGTTATVKK